MDLGDLDIENRTTERAQEDTLMHDMPEIGKSRYFIFTKLVLLI